MTQYGEFPGVRTKVEGGQLTGVVVGVTQKLVMFGAGDPDTATADPGVLTEVASRQDAQAKFGEGSHLSEQLRRAIGNGAHRDYAFGLMVDSSEETESFTGTQSAQLSVSPVLRDESTVSAQDTSNAVSVSVEFRFWTGTDLTNNPPSGDNQIFLNPVTGEWVADESGSYEITYRDPDWDGAIAAADRALNPEETGVYAALTDNETVANTLFGKTRSLRKSEYKMIRAVAGSQPNLDSASGNGYDPGLPHYDSSTYTDAIDREACYLHAPSMSEEGQFMTGGIAGLFAGHSLTDPVYNDPVNGYIGAAQDLTRVDIGNFRDEEVMPIVQRGSLRVKDSGSTSSATDWERDHFTRRIVDQIILIVKAIGDAIIGRINNDTTRAIAETEIRAEILSLVRQDILKPNPDDGDAATEPNWTVNVREDPNDAQQANIEIGVTPFGVVKRVDETVTINE